MKYRNNCIHPTTLNALWSMDPDMFTNVNYVVARANRIAKYGTYDEYLEWVDDWRTVYKQISGMISYLKDNEWVKKNNGTLQDQQAALIAGRLIANTLLNARQYAKDVRRGIRERNS